MYLPHPGPPPDPVEPEEADRDVDPRTGSDPETASESEGHLAAKLTTFIVVWPRR